MKFNRILAIASIILVAGLTSCQKENVAPTGMSLDQTSVTVYVGQTATVTPVYSPSNATASPEWTSSDEKVATVEGGYVTGVKAGKATITAKAGSYTAACTVTVSNVEATSVTLSATSLTLYEGEKGVQLTATVAPDNTTFPAITWTSSNTAVATVDANGNVAQVGLGDATITASVAGGQKATCSVKVTVRTPTTAETLDFWKSDAAGHRGLYGATADNNKTAGTGNWLSYKDGIAYWTANTTGKVRTATLTLSTGSKLTVTQFEGADLRGDSYTFNAKFFSNNKTWGAANGNGKKTVTFGKPYKGETLTDLDGSKYTNCIGISGLYFEAIMDATVVIDYDAKTCKLGLFLDARDNAQKVNNSVSGYNYVAFLPEMGTGTGSSWTSPWNFVQPDLGTDQDYCWLWLTFDSTLTKATWNSFTEAQFVNSNLKTSANRIIGITCAVSKSNKCDATNVSATYNVIFQANVNSTSTTPISFTKD